MSYISIDDDEENKNSIHTAHTAAATAATNDDDTRQNLETAFRNASSEDSSNSIITTTSPQTTNNDDSDKENICSSASSIASESQTEVTYDLDQRLVNAENEIKLLNAQIARLRAEHHVQTTELTREHELEIQSIGCLQINTCRINTDTKLCEQELLKLQTRFATQFGPPAFESKPTNWLLSRFHKIQAALADLRQKIPALNSIAEQQNLSLLRIRQDAQTHTAHALQIFETYTNLWHQTTKQHEDALRTQIPTLLHQEQLLLNNIHELTTLLQQVPGNAGNVVAYMRCGALDILQLNNDKLTKQFLTYDSKLAAHRFKLAHASHELMQIQLTAKSALTAFQDYFPKQHTTNPIAVCTNTYRTGFVKGNPKTNVTATTITQATSLPPKLYDFKRSADIKLPPKLIK
eukprot:gene16520-18201_t